MASRRSRQMADRPPVLMMWNSTVGGQAVALPGRRDRSLNGKARRKAARAARQRQ